ncbi:hypothetical protein [Streptomyces griseorubiginosus]|uniref:hypothetical protein n=1 Tax=Streptomyces griseorubiginosus TaxID=67304 RepID=UPI0033FF21A9
MATPRSPSRGPWSSTAGDGRNGVTGSPFQAATDGPAYTALGKATQEVYGKPLALLGQDGSIPLCNILATAYRG